MHDRCIPIIRTSEAFDSDWFVLIAYRQRSAVNNGETSSDQRLLLLNLRRLHFFTVSGVNKRRRVVFAVFKFSLKFYI